MQNDEVISARMHVSSPEKSNGIWRNLVLGNRY